MWFVSAHSTSLGILCGDEKPAIIVETAWVDFIALGRFCNYDFLKEESFVERVTAGVYYRSQIKMARYYRPAAFLLRELKIISSTVFCRASNLLSTARQVPMGQRS